MAMRSEELSRAPALVDNRGSIVRFRLDAARLMRLWCKAAAANFGGDKPDTIWSYWSTNSSTWIGANSGTVSKRAFSRRRGDSVCGGNAISSAVFFGRVARMTAGSKGNKPVWWKPVLERLKKVGFGQRCESNAGGKCYDTTEMKQKYIIIDIKKIVLNYILNSIKIYGQILLSTIAIRF